ncbi:hypothetical protein J6590_063516 [Homalodisca vitripennis]|nr:hypothetical protein J6590_063516 [Homalodisca vitripennis]
MYADYIDVSYSNDTSEELEINALTWMYHKPAVSLQMTQRWSSVSDQCSHTPSKGHKTSRLKEYQSWSPEVEVV